ncbi:MAG: DUF1365 domain-containing protein [Solirubrobacteraceae bacterium]
MRPASCIYEGTIRHRRTDPRRSFQHRIALFYLDLEALPGLLEGRLVRPRPGPLRFRRGDYLGPERTPLEDAVRETVRAETGHRPEGPIRMLTQLRSFGHCFNPVSFYYCLDGAGEHVDAVVADVTNTPWGERHAYVIPGTRGEVTKALHVSPFMAMDHRYRVHAGTPGERLAIHISSHRDDAPAFDATLALRRRELTRAAAARLALRYPFANLRVLALIYGHAVGLKLAGVPFHRHPARGST